MFLNQHYHLYPNGEIVQTHGILTPKKTPILKIETAHQTVTASQEEVYNFLMDMNNFEQLLPQDKITDWEASNEICTMKIKNMGNLGLKRVF